MVKAVATSGKAVFIAGCTVIISLAGMYLIGIGFVSGLATGAIIAVAMTIATSLTLLPAILGFVGKNIDKLHVPGVSRGEHESDGFWYRWSRLIQRRPVPVRRRRSVVLLVLASPVSTIQLGSSDDGNRPTKDTTRRAYDLLAGGLRAGLQRAVAAGVRRARRCRRRRAGAGARRGGGHPGSAVRVAGHVQPAARHRGDAGVPHDVAAGSEVGVADPSPARRRLAPRGARHGHRRARRWHHRRVRRRERATSRRACRSSSVSCCCCRSSCCWWCSGRCSCR